MDNYMVQPEDSKESDTMEVEAKDKFGNFTLEKTDATKGKDESTKTVDIIRKDLSTIYTFLLNNIDIDKVEVLTQLIEDYNSGYLQGKLQQKNKTLQDDLQSSSYQLFSALEFKFKLESVKEEINPKTKENVYGAFKQKFQSCYICDQNIYDPEISQNDILQQLDSQTNDNDAIIIFECQQHAYHFKCYKEKQAICEQKCKICPARNQILSLSEESLPGFQYLDFQCGTIIIQYLKQNTDFPAEVNGKDNFCLPGNNQGENILRLCKGLNTRKLLFIQQNNIGLSWNPDIMPCQPVDINQQQLNILEQNLQNLANNYQFDL